ncbi:MAG: hypothetical protein P4L33_05835 [Capsulimonadaceae bacterium]|nr:hypothetical protein [Capsulimonadaceae bacterium]
MRFAALVELLALLILMTLLAKSVEGPKTHLRPVPPPIVSSVSVTTQSAPPRRERWLHRLPR